MARNASHILGPGSREKILQRVRRLLSSIDPEVHLVDVVLDSTREQLALVLQKSEWPIVLGMSWLDYVSHRDDELARRLEDGLRKRLEVARQRQAREED